MFIYIKQEYNDRLRNKRYTLSRDRKIENERECSLISDFAVHCIGIAGVVKIKTLIQRKKYALGNVLGFYFLQKHTVA